MTRRELVTVVGSLAVVLLVWILMLTHSPLPRSQAHLPGTGSSPSVSPTPATDSPTTGPGQPGSSNGSGHTYINGTGRAPAGSGAVAGGPGVDQEDIQEGDREDDGPTATSSPAPSSSHQGSGGGLVGTVTSALPTIKPSSPLPLPSPSIP